MLSVSERAPSKKHDVWFNAGAGLIPTWQRDGEDTVHDDAGLSPSLSRAASNPLGALGQIEFCPPPHRERGVALLIDITIRNITEYTY